ncbi:immunoglobulin e-set [Lucifera butyrica]|uniref:1,4-alpha-glucan branching enzyme GlgB n=1 Tax=Lucifera butyrica TaxID=1351585 RepID=A0A498R451_9FIRM|nr:1,4-alpha-glucan branching protein GlgB [Lucifera butyrica]VBB05042.1 immunoglobulin e-set [Lucifera butyrica]
MHITDTDLFLFNEGTQFRAYRFMGAHCRREGGRTGVRFAVWAPNAAAVSVVGDFNHWDGNRHPLQLIGQSGIWSSFVPGLAPGEVYKFEIRTAGGGLQLKADPYGFFAEVRPGTASVVYELDHYVWQDKKWQHYQQQNPSYEQPMLIYEVHAGSWRFTEKRQPLTYRELAEQLVDYVADMGYTHIEFLPLAEHPFDGSWGYQATGYYAVTSRYGTPDDFRYFVDRCHQRGIGVILDWVPGHFCKDDQGLRRFDGTALYEHEDCRRGENEWGTANFNLGRYEVQSFLISNALFWFDVYHIDGLRVDAVASMLYLDYGRKDQCWFSNQYGGRENIEAIDFLRKLNERVFENYPQALMIAEESTAWPLVSRPTYLGGLGFNYKWNMGWMNDVLKYMEMDPLFRQWHHNLLTFSFLYAFSENFILPLSHDEVVHGKRSLLDKMPGDYWQKFAGVRTFYAYMMAHPGKKLIFMGGEFGQFIEWKYYDSLDWHLLEYEKHRKLWRYMKELNHFYRRERSLWQQDHDWPGFSWIDCDDSSQSIVSFLRMGRNKHDFLVIVANFTSVVRDGYRIGVPRAGKYREIFNSDNTIYGGSGQKNTGVLPAKKKGWHNQPFSLVLKIPPLATVYLKLQPSWRLKKFNGGKGYAQKGVYCHGAGGRTRQPLRNTD